MAVTLASDLLQDDIVVSLARAVGTANKRARVLGIDLAETIMTITQNPVNGDVVWRVSYGPNEYIGHRGGDLIIDVNSSDSTIVRELWGQ